MRPARLSTLSPSERHAGACGQLLTQEDIAAMRPAFARSLDRDLDLALLAGRLCPVLLADGRVAVFALAEYAAGDQIEELERLLLKRGYALAAPARYILPAALLLSIARGQLSADTLRSQTGALAIRQGSALLSVFTDIVQWGVRRGASDIHINIDMRAAHSELRYTIDGAYVAPACFHGMSSAMLLEVLAVAWMEVRGGNGAVFDPLVEQQGRLAIDIEQRPIVLRWASLATDAGPSVCLRVLRLDMTRANISLQSLGYLPTQIEQLEQARDRQGGALVLAGVVGSGKSTTLAALLRGVPPTRKLITLEDPVEYRIGNALQNTVGRALDEAPGHGLQAKLKTIKRSAMNDLLIGELRDLDTGRAFMDLAGSGTSVYTTTHTGSACMIPERLASDFIGVSRDFLATPGVLKLLVYQVLLPRLCAHCALPLDSLWRSAPPRSASAAAQAQYWRCWAQQTLPGSGAGALRVRNPSGCAVCCAVQLPELYGTAGRSVVAEIIAPDHDGIFLELLRRRDNPGLLRYARQQARSALDDPDMHGKSVLECAFFKALQGELDPRDIERNVGALSGLGDMAQRRTEAVHA